MMGAITVGLLNPDFSESVENILSRCKDSAGDGVSNPENATCSDLFGNEVAVARISSNDVS